MSELEPRDYVARRIAASGVLSRRQAAAAVAAGRVRVDGEIVFNALAELRPGARVELDGGRLPDPARRVVYMLHKPRGWICSTRDRFSPRLAWRLLPELPGVRWFSAGRLDAASEGLIIFTNAGSLAHELENPARRILKHYQVVTSCRLPGRALAEFRAGFVEPASGGRLRVESVAEIQPCDYVFVLSEGRRHEIRRMVQYGGATVRKLVRFQIGDLPLGDLAPGACRALTAPEIAALTSGVEQDDSAPGKENR